jgi:stearoyl-CoA desaturase (delta-9 desaturase)
LFSWTGLLLVPLGHFLFNSIGIGLCFHRTLAHRSLAMPRWLERTFAVFAICSLQDSPLHWVAIHRMHHQHSDKDEDPHSPRAGFFWSHTGWLLLHRRDRSRREMYEKYAPDLLRDPFYSGLEHNLLWVWICVAHTVLFGTVGFAIGWGTSGNLLEGVRFGLSLVVWGVIVRTVWTWHLTWSVNSVTHLWGYRNYETPDDSRNHWIVALLTTGEGWHNNHHADPRSARHGHRWWELDLTYSTILLLEKCGLAWDVVRPRAFAKIDATEAHQGTERVAPFEP